MLHAIVDISGGLLGYLGIRRGNLGFGHGHLLAILGGLGVCLGPLEKFMSYGKGPKQLTLLHVQAVCV